MKAKLEFDFPVEPIELNLRDSRDREVLKKIMLEFDLIEYDEVDSLKRALMADDMANFIWELRYNFFRKYEDVDDDEAEASWYTVQKDILEAISELPFDIDSVLK